MRSAFYDNPQYQKQQSYKTRQLWQLGKYNFLIKPLENRICKNPICTANFEVKPGDPKIFCGKSCAVSTNNQLRTPSEETKLKIALALKNRHSGIKRQRRRNNMPVRIKPWIKLICLQCKKKFERPPYLARRQKFCSVTCSIKTTGRLTTSPKAAKSKPGIRIDIDPNICFYSTWEANIARAFNLIGIKWEFGPKIFNLGKHTYRPDFYLPEDDIFIEVKNFMNDYSLERDRLFREKYPNLKLEVLSKDIYKEIESNYKPFIDNWEA